MAIGNKGFYATTQAPNVDFGAMVDKGIDKKLARDAAEDAARAKAKADKAKAIQEDLDEIGKVDYFKQTGLDGADAAGFSYIDSQRKKQADLIRKFKDTQNKEYKNAAEQITKDVSVVGDTFNALSGHLNKVAENEVKQDGGYYDSKSLEDFYKMNEKFENGDFAVRSDKSGRPVMVVFDRDEKGNVIPESIQNFNSKEVLGEPLLKSQKENTISEFKKTYEQDYSKEATSAVSSEARKTIGENLKTRIGNAADVLMANSNEAKIWYRDKYGENLKGELTEDQEKLWKEDLVKDFESAYPEWFEGTQKQWTQPSGSGKITVNTSKDASVVNAAPGKFISQEGTTNDKGVLDGAAFVSIKDNKNKNIKISDNRTVQGLYYGAEGAYVAVKKIDTEGVSAGINTKAPGVINEETGKEEGAVNVNASVRDSGKGVETFYYAEGTAEYKEVMDQLQDGKDAKTRAYNVYIAEAEKNLPTETIRDIKYEITPYLIRSVYKKYDPKVDRDEIVPFIQNKFLGNQDAFIEWFYDKYKNKVKFKRNKQDAVAYINKHNPRQKRQEDDYKAAIQKEDRKIKDKSRSEGKNRAGIENPQEKEEKKAKSNKKSLAQIKKENPNLSSSEAIKMFKNQK